ncbi:MAG: hypothetical protein E7Y34_01420 [Mycoplasma sp.]|nr:hypothetical protein [Mycoplasma sp.]
MSKLKNWFKSYKVSKIDDKIKEQIIEEYKNSDRYITDIQKELEIDFEGQECNSKCNDIKELKDKIDTDNNKNKNIEEILKNEK